MASMSTARTTSHPTAPTDLPTWALRTEDLEAMLATDDDTVDTAVIPRLAYREAIEGAAVTGVSTVATVETAALTSAPQTDESVETAVPPVGHSLRNRHASPESVAAIRRNLIALATVLVATVVLGAGITWTGGWIALVGYALLVLGFSVALRQANSRYAPRHSRYTPRHA